MFVFAAGFIMIAFAIRFFKDEIMLYKNGVKNEATLILMKPYNHVDINEVRNKVYYVGIEPILEVNNEDKKVIIEYDDYDEFKDLKVGDKVKVIYPKENISEIKRYSFLKINSYFYYFCRNKFIIKVELVPLFLLCRYYFIDFERKFYYY